MSTLQRRWEDVQQTTCLSNANLTFNYTARVDFFKECARQKGKTLDEDALKDLQQLLQRTGIAYEKYLFTEAHTTWCQIYPDFWAQAKPQLIENLPKIKQELESLNSGKLPDARLRGIIKDFTEDINKYVTSALLKYGGLADNNKFIDAVRDPALQKINANRAIQTLADLKFEGTAQRPWFPDGEPPTAAVEYLNLVAKACASLDTAMTALSAEYKDQIISHLLAIQKVASSLINSFEPQEPVQKQLDYLATIASETEALKQAPNIKPVPRMRQHKSGIVKWSNYRIAAPTDGYKPPLTPFDASYAGNSLPWLLYGICLLDCEATKGVQKLSTIWPTDFGPKHCQINAVQEQSTRLWRVSLPWLEFQPVNEGWYYTNKIPIDKGGRFAVPDPDRTYPIEYGKGREFSEPPDIVFWIRGFEVDTTSDNLSWNICPWISKIEKTWFDIKFEALPAGSNTTAAPMASVTIQWLAVAKNASKGVAMGHTKRFKITDTQKSDEQKITIPKEKVTTALNPPPGVFVAINQFRGLAKQSVRPWLQSSVEQSGDVRSLNIKASSINDETQAEFSAAWIVTD